MRLPHLDTVHPGLCRLPEAELEPLKHTLVKMLLEICRDSGWALIITFKDGNLPTVCRASRPHPGKACSAPYLKLLVA